MTSLSTNDRCGTPFAVLCYIQVSTPVQCQIVKSGDPPILDPPAAVPHQILFTCYLGKIRRNCRNMASSATGLRATDSSKGNGLLLYFHNYSFYSQKVCTLQGDLAFMLFIKSAAVVSCLFGLSRSFFLYLRTVVDFQLVLMPLAKCMNVCWNTVTHVHIYRVKFHKTQPLFSGGYGSSREEASIQNTFCKYSKK